MRGLVRSGVVLAAVRPGATVIPARVQRFGLASAVALVGVFAGFGGTASAAVTGLQFVQQPSPSNSSDKSVTVSCPPGKQVVGGGADVIGGGGQVAVNEVISNGALTSVTAQALEDQTGTANNWFVRAYANCATPPPGLERVLAASPNDSLNKTVTATCPAGQRLLGGGGEISGGGRAVVLEDIRLNNLASVTVQGVEAEGGTTADWLARAFAICADPIASLERIVATGPSNSGDNKNASATCPAGKQLLGVGAELGGGGGQVVLSHMVPTSTVPFSNLADGAFANGLEDENGTTGNWFVRAMAICAAASQRVVAQSPDDSLAKTATATCPAGKQVTGVGGDLTGGAGQVLLDELLPFQGDARAGAFEDDDGTTSSWFLRTYAICATPLPGREVVFATSAQDSSDKSVIATCPNGKRVIGAGGGTVAGLGQVVIDEVAPNAALTAVTVHGSEDEDGYPSDWLVRARMVCADPPPGLELVTATTEPDSDPASVPATCPSGKNLLGTGAAIDGGAGQVFLDDVRPNAALTNNTVTGLEDGTGFASDWSLRSHAICANP